MRVRTVGFLEMRRTISLPRFIQLALATLATSLSSWGCDRKESSEPSPSSTLSAKTSAKIEAAAPEPPRPEPPAVVAPTCPEGMVLLPGGPFWAGAEHESFEQEENPRFLTRLAPFCLDLTEVTTAAYQACVDAGACRPARTKYKTCNAGRSERAQHPINCVDHDQASSFCAWRNARLPSEIEWEFAARGGAEQRKYPWGDASPDGHTCWKAALSCPVKSYPPGAFGLYDVVGNVWEWTSDWFAPYPWPAETGQHRVYRGGSWSRRFEKWMRPTLRNRFRPDHWGSHLGVRCALSPEPLECPYGPGEGEHPCRRGVDEARCLDGKQWNGARCSAPGAPQCPEGTTLRPGRGCVSPSGGSVSPSSPRSSAHETPAQQEAEAKAEEVRRIRSPEFDDDCRQNQPSRPRAYRYEGGSHAARNISGGRDGCKNRDVGVGWNSACCP